ncbi:MAG: hypothetical protein GQ569_11960 [Methylococcaceae bacterium]|nr:hypothetical protein [Methylococcaceae bacterium]
MLEQQLFNEVLKLPLVARANFAEKVFESLHESEPALSDKWLEEINKRIKEYESGQAKTRSAKEVFAKYGLEWK